jgi:nitrite reductase/ring-hydroxylating ferredoxin subunit
VPPVELISLTRCRKGGGTFVRHGERELAVFWLTDPERFFVIDNPCPHAGGSLSGGEVAGNVVTCPWHYWQFNLDTGLSTHSDHVRVRHYRTQIRNGTVWADLPD